MPDTHRADTHRLAGTVHDEKGSPMAGKWELYTDKGGEYRFRLKAGNGEVIALSSEGYTSKSGALNGIESIRKNAGSDIVETDK